MSPADQSYLLTLAGLLRDGTLADPPAGYAPAERERADAAMARVLVRVSAALTREAFLRPRSES